MLIAVLHGRTACCEQAVAHASPRSQTIDGASPGAAGGLLGAVKKDSVTSDHLAEAGPLTVANHGVCCIQHLEKLTVHHAVSSKPGDLGTAMLLDVKTALCMMHSLKGSMVRNVAGCARPATA